MSRAVRTLGRVLKDRLAEIDRHILLTKDPRELKRLWRSRRRTLKVWRILTGFAE